MKQTLKFALRKADFCDIEFLWYLRNREETRRYSKNNKKIKWQEHINWIMPILLGFGDKQIFIIENYKTPVGQIRFDHKNKDGLEISISILKEFWGKGIAYESLFSAIKLKKEIKVFYAEINKNNPASLRLFEKLGFVFKKSRKGWIIYEKLT